MTPGDAKRILRRAETAKDRIRTLERHLVTLTLCIQYGRGATKPDAVAAAITEGERLLEVD